MTSMRPRCRPGVTTLAFMAAAALALRPNLAAMPQAPSGRSEAAPSEQINLGVLRADGILLPFAAFDGEDWKTPWPADLQGRELPVSLSSVPSDWWAGAEPEQWRLFSGDDKPVATFKAMTLTMIMVGQQRRLGLRTDRAPESPTPPPFVLPSPKSGLAVSGDVGVKAIPSVSRTGPAPGQLVQSIRRELNEAEERTVGGIRANTLWRHPFDRTARARVEPQIEAWYRTALPEPGALVSYIEVVKKYPPLPIDDGCGLETFITGWVHQDETQTKPRTQLKAAVMYCDRDTASYMLPLGQLQVRNRVHWIFQMSGRDHEWYAAAEVTRTRTRVVAEYFAGGLLRMGGR
jgi:hypothetical protein